MHQDMGRVSCTEYFLDVICYSVQLSSSHEKLLQHTMCRGRLCLHVKAADLGPKARMSPILLCIRKLERCLKEVEDALQSVHDIPEQMTDSTLYASESTGAVPSGAEMNRVFTKWHEQVQLGQAAWHAASTRKWQRLFVVVLT